MDLLREPKTQKIMGIPRTTIHIDRKTESLRKEDNAVHLVGSEGCGVPWTSETRWNSEYRLLTSTTDQFEPCIDRKAPRLGYKTRKTDFAARQRLITHSKRRQRYHFCTWLGTLAHPPYSPDLAPSDYHLFSSMSQALSQQHFNNYEDVEKWLADWITSKCERFFWEGIHNLKDRWANIASDGAYFE